MKIQLVEAYEGGHHTNYIEALLPKFRDALKHGDINAVRITVTQSHFEALLAQGIAQVESENIHFDPSFPSISPDPSFKDRCAIFTAFNQVISAFGADAVIAPSADYDVMVNAILKKQARFGGLTATRAVGIFHYGYPTNAQLSWKEKLKQFIYETAWRHANWHEYLFVNPVVYESLKAKHDAFSNKLTLLPDPAPPKLSISMHDAREELGIPSDGIYIGFVGMMDARKAVPEVLAAFDAQQLFKKCKLLLLGQLAAEYETLIKMQYQHLVDQQHIVIVNRHLSQHEVQLGYVAMNAITLLQYRRMNLSANLLKAVANDKLIIADDCGYTGMMIKRFALGYVCQVDNTQSLGDALVQAVTQIESYQPSVQTERLKAFHHPDNYAKTIMQALVPHQRQDDLLTWDWVCEGLSD